MAETKIQLGIPKEARVAVYQGTVNFGRIPKTLIQSMTSWPKDTYLLIIGPTPDEMKQTILTITGSSSENSRVRYLPWPADHNILPITVGSHLGIGISASTDINMRHIAGASNKFFEYLTCGIPVLVNDFTEIRNLFGYTGCIFGADVLSPADISRAVNEALQINQRPIESARASHRDRFNFQTQFAPVERWIEHLS
jgi:hypothetical protein